MDSLTQFGIEPFYLLAQIVNFLVLLYLLKRFLYKPILEMLKKREEKIHEGLAAGAKGEALLIKAKEGEKEILHKAGEEAGILIEETKEHVTKLEQELLERAKDESEEMLKRARVQIAQEERLREKELEQKIITVAANMLERTLPTILTKEDQMRILASSERLLKKVLT